MSSLGIFDKETKTYKKVADLSNNVSHAVSADRASSAYSVADYNNTDVNIKIGYYGDGLSCDQIRHIAGFTGDGNSDIRIKDVSKNELKSWLGDATTSDHGLMTPDMVSKLNGIVDKWNNSSSADVTVLNVNSPYSGTVVYTVRFGICTVYINGITAPSDQSDKTILEGLPAACMPGTWLIHDATNKDEHAKLGARVSMISNQGILICHKVSGCTKLEGSFSYPIFV